MVEAVCTSKTLVYFRKTTQHYFPENCLHTCHHENLKSHMMYMLLELLCAIITVIIFSIFHRRKEVMPVLVRTKQQKQEEKVMQRLNLQKKRVKRRWYYLTYHDLLNYLHHNNVCYLNLHVYKCTVHNSCTVWCAHMCNF
jgi:hypothetical protein